MAHRSLNSLVFAGFEPTTSATLISLMGNEGLPPDVHLIQGLNSEPWHAIRSGLMIIGMDPTTDFVRVSQLIQNRTTFWDVAVCIQEVLNYYSVALLAQGAVKVLPHPEEDLEGAKKGLRNLLLELAEYQSDAFGLDLSDLIQLYGEKRIARTIRLIGGGTAGSIYLHNGNVIHVETMDDLEGMSALQRLISIEKPELRIHKGCLTDKKTMGIPAMSALLEGSRQVDEHTHQSSRMDSSMDMVDIGAFSADQVPNIPPPPPPSGDGNPSTNESHFSLFDDDELDFH